MKRKHFDAIDGLKGIAILAVVCTHIPLGVWFQFIPQIIRPILNPLLSGGGVGVNIFFITTGFLMGFLYPVLVSPVTFYARRYSRLFPAFLVMVFSFTIIKLINMPVYVELFVVFGCAIFMRLLWQIFHGKNLIYFMLLFQLIVALWYVFYLLKVPASVFYINWGKEMRIIVTAFINATLTLPFGTYIDQFDGIYWALCAEVFFYLIYPFIIPIIQYVNRQVSSLGKLLLFIVIIPFCYGLFMISERTLNFIMIQPHLIIYFIIGIFIGINTNLIKQRLTRFQQLFAHPAWIIFLLVVIFSSVTVDGYLIKYWQRWFSILMVVPISLLLLTIVAAKDESKSILKNRILKFLGKYSYAIFLTHSVVIHVVLKYIPEEGIFNGILIVIFSFFGVLAISRFLYKLVEQPYFLSRKSQSLNTGDQIRKTPSFLESKNMLLILVACILLLAYNCFKPPVAFFTFVFRHGGYPAWSVMKNKTITLSDKPYRQSFVSRENNLGMVNVSLRRDKIPGKEGGFVPFELYMRLKDNDKIIAQSKYLAYQIIESRNHPFGFPIIKNSKGKKYQIEYQLSVKGYSEEIKLVTNEADMLSIYFLKKNELLKNPSLLIKFIIHKLGEPLMHPVFWLTFAFISPFLFALILDVYFFGSSRPYGPKDKLPE